jgi:hypothetical protein
MTDSEAINQARQKWMDRGWGENLFEKIIPDIQRAYQAGVEAGELAVMSKYQRAVESLHQPGQMELPL